MSKTAVYSWRLPPELKLALAEAARKNHESIADLLERIARNWLTRSASPEDEATQRRLHARAAKFLGTIAGDDAERATNARELVRARLARRRERRGS